MALTQSDITRVGEVIAKLEAAINELHDIEDATGVQFDTMNELGDGLQEVQKTHGYALDGDYDDVD